MNSLKNFCRRQLFLIFVIIIIVVLILVIWKISQRKDAPDIKQTDGHVVINEYYSWYRNNTDEFYSNTTKDGAVEINEHKVEEALLEVLPDYFSRNPKFHDFITKDSIPEGYEDYLDNLAKSSSSFDIDEETYKLYVDQLSYAVDASSIGTVCGNQEPWNINIIVTGPVISDAIFADFLYQIKDNDVTQEDYYKFLKEYFKTAEYSEQLINTSVFVTDKGKFLFTEVPEEALGLVNNYRYTSFLNVDSFKEYRKNLLKDLFFIDIEKNEIEYDHNLFLACSPVENLDVSVSTVEKLFEKCFPTTLYTIKVADVGKETTMYVVHGYAYTRAGAHNIERCPMLFTTYNENGGKDLTWYYEAIQDSLYDVGSEALNDEVFKSVVSYYDYEED